MAESTGNAGTAGRPKITIRRLFEVECAACGVVDSCPSRDEAGISRRDHLKRHGGADSRG